MDYPSSSTSPGLRELYDRLTCLKYGKGESPRRINLVVMGEKDCNSREKGTKLGQ